MPDALFEAIVRTRSERVHILTEVELSDLRLDPNDPALQEIEDSHEARAWRLTKEEYFSRKERVAQQCKELLPDDNEKLSQTTVI